MDWKQFVSSIVAALAWPFVAVVLLVLLRKHLAGLAARLEEVTFGGAKAKFVRELERARDDSATLAPQVEIGENEPPPKADDRFLKLANEFPEAAVIEAYKGVEQALYALAQHLGTAVRPPAIIKRLEHDGYATTNLLRSLDSLRSARNAAAHGGGGNRITPGEALEFREQAEIVRNALIKILVDIEGKKKRPQ